jgi:hypothetical protein
MKFTKDFVSILKVFSGVSQNMFFRKGNVQSSAVITKKTKSAQFFVRAHTDVEIDGEFAVGSLPNFIDTLKMFNEPEITIDETSLTLVEGQKNVHYKLTRPEYISYHENPDQFQVKVGIETALTRENVDDILKMSGIFDAKYVSFVGKDGKFLVQIHSGGMDRFSNNGSIELGTTDETFNATIGSELFKVPLNQYKVVVSRKGFVYLGNEVFEYFIPTDANHSELG